MSDITDWNRELFEALKHAEKVASSGGAYGMADRLSKMAAVFGSVIKDEEVADLVAEVAGVKRTTKDVCIVHVPEHWIEGLRSKAEIPIKS